MKRPFLRLCLGLLWLGSTGCDSKTREFGTAGAGSGSTSTGAAGADAAAGTGISTLNPSALGGNSANAPSNSSQVSGSGQTTPDGATPNGTAGDAEVAASSGAGAGTAGNPPDGGPHDGDAGSGSSGPGGSGTPDSATGNGSSGDSGTGGSGSASALAAATEFCDDYYAGICKRRVACGRDCTSGGGYRNYPIECHDALASLKQGYLTYNPDNAAECLAGYELSGCPSGDPTACALVFSGTVAIAEECAATEFAKVFDECATGFCKRAQLQDPQRLACLGTCAAFSGLGKTCDENSTLNLRCAPELVCVDNKCEVPGGIDVSCEDIPCQAGLVCSDVAPITCRDPGPEHSTCRDSGDCTTPAVCVNSECVVWVAEGGFCRNDGSCMGGYCVDNVCAPVVAAGATCSNDDRCTVGFDCSLYEPRVCIKAIGDEDEPCGPWGRCNVGLWCTDSQVGTCVSTLGEGETCTDNDNCNADLRCMADGKCHTPGVQDGPCVPEAPYATCAAGFFCDQETALCDAPRAEDETCNSLTRIPSQSCQTGLYCLCVGDDCPSPQAPHLEDHCVPQQADGTSCGNTTECLSGGCVGALCGPPPAPVPNCTR